MAERLLARHGCTDSSLLMYYDRCREEMSQALDKLPPCAHGTQIESPYRTPVPSHKRVTGHGAIV